jgi:hypothetical protein
MRLSRPSGDSHRFARIEFAHYISGALPSQLLHELGIDSTPATVTITVLALIGTVSTGLVALWKLGARVLSRWRPRDPETKRLLSRRQKFAGHVADRIRDLNRAEKWDDFYFAELEAEVETDWDSHQRWGFGKPFGRQRGLRRERSLSKALIKSRERLILLQGDPGSGKSVALRFVTGKMALKAARSKRTDAVIPLYVNLRELRTDGREVDEKLIEGFVQESLRKGGGDEVDGFLKEEFAKGKEAGSWFFLFDSFDEIPEVLSSTEGDAAVRAYSDAISSFMRGMHSCRGVIASRHFRAPQGMAAPTYRIVPLSERRQLDLIGKADIGDARTRLEAHMRRLPPELATLATNPLFLGLLAGYVRDRQALPEGWHEVFEAFVSRRLETDRERLERHFQISSEVLRRRSEEIAFTMTAAKFGLSPMSKDIKQAYMEMGFAAPANFEAVISALASIKLGRVDSETSQSGDETFTFAHRRLQEYFATCVVLREPNRISARTMLTDGRWRETAVTLCHTQPDHVEALVAEADALLAQAETTDDDGDDDFFWRHGALHLLSLLQSAFAGRARALPAELRQRVAAILHRAWDRGTITDRKWALEVTGTAPAIEMEDLLLRALRGPSPWLREVAYRQVARLAEVPANIAAEIRRVLIGKAAHLELQRDWTSTRAQLLRLRPSEPFIRTAQLLRVAPIVDAGVLIGGYVATVTIDAPALPTAVIWALMAALVHYCYYRIAATIAFLSLNYLDVGALGIRLLVAVAPLGSIPLLPAVVWLYASTWSVAVTIAALHETPQVRRWPLIPLLWLWGGVRQFRENRRDWITVTSDIPRPDDRGPETSDDRESRASLRSWIAFGAAWLVLLIVLGASVAFFIALSNWMASIPKPFLESASALLGVFVLFGLVSYGVHQIRVWAMDRRNHRRRFGSDRTEMTAAELLACLTDMRMETSAIRGLREVRVRRLLREDAEAAWVVRDLLEAIESPWNSLDAEGEAWWKSDVFGSWLRQGGSIGMRRLRNSSNELHDELGLLLEELERPEELPFA